MNSKTSTKQTKAQPDKKMAESTENISAMKQNQNMYNDVPVISSREFRESRFGCPCIMWVTSSQELGTMSKNNLEGLPWVEGLYKGFTLLPW